MTNTHPLVINDCYKENKQIQKYTDKERCQKYIRKDLPMHLIDCRNKIVCVFDKTNTNQL